MKRPLILIFCVLVASIIGLFVPQVIHRENSPRKYVSKGGQFSSMIYYNGDISPVRRHIFYDTEVLSVRGGSSFPITMVDYFGAFPGEIEYLDVIRTRSGLRLLFVGSNFVAVNGTDFLWYSPSDILGYDVGDLDMDGVDEVVVLTSDDYLIALDDCLSVVWRRWLGGFAGLVDRVFIANAASSDYSLIFTYKFNGSLIIYWNYSGDYVWHAEKISGWYGVKKFLWLGYMRLSMVFICWF